MTELLRQYETHGADGYPYPWHHETGLTVNGHRITTRDLPEGTLTELRPPIKDLIREMAGHRCQRCGHPYSKGEHPIEETPDGPQLWSPCDWLCRHRLLGSDARWRPRGEEWRPGSPSLRDLAGLGNGDVYEQQSLWRVLTVHHLDEDKLNCRWWNLAALCQRCHLRMQRGVVMGRPYHFEHSDWFKPFAAGFYAWKYLGEDLTREEVDARMPELLALEHRFTQEALL